MMVIIRIIKETALVSFYMMTRCMSEIGKMTKDKDLAIEMQFEDNSFRDIKPLIGQECIRAYVNPVTDGMDIYANWRICGLACEFKADEVKNTISFVIRYNSAELIQMWPNGNVGEKIAIKILDL